METIRNINYEMWLKNIFNTLITNAKTIYEFTSKLKRNSISYKYSSNLFNKRIIVSKNISEIAYAYIPGIFFHYTYMYNFTETT